MFFAMMWYVSLLQHRGALYFKAQLPQPNRSQRRTSTEPEPASGFQSPSLSKLLDLMQSWYAPVIGFMLWMLLRAGVYSRGWHCFTLTFIQMIWGVRSAFSIVTLRLATLRRVTSMVRNILFCFVFLPC